MKVGFILLSPAANAIPSTRIAVLNVLPALAGHGIEASVLYAPATAQERPALPETLGEQAGAAGLDLVVFQKVHGPSVLALSAQLARAGIATACLVCDRVDNEMVAATDGTVIVTEYLRSLHAPELQPRIHVVHDGIEHPERRHAPVDAAAPRSRVLEAVLVTSSRLLRLPVLGMPPPWLRVTIVGRYADSPLRRAREATWDARAASGWREAVAVAGFQLHPRIRCVPWSVERTYQALERADVGIIPIDADEPPAEPGTLPPDWKRKSENRLTLKMAVGLPVVATPIPAYLPVVEQGVNGFLAHSRTEWLDCLDALRDPALRNRVGLAARASVLHRFSIEEQARKLALALRSIRSARAH